MRVYKLAADVEHFWSISPVDTEAYLKVIRLLDGEPIGDSWSPISFEMSQKGDRGGALLKGDLFGFTPNIPVFSERSVEVLRDLVGGHAEVFPLYYNSEVLYVLNVYRHDVLDEPRSKLERFKSSGRVKKVVWHEFKRSELDTNPIFRLPQLSNSPVYVTDRFVRRVQEAELRGFMFTEVWPNDPRKAVDDDSPMYPVLSTGDGGPPDRVLPKERRLADDELERLKSYASKGLARLKTSANEPEAVIRALESYVESRRKQRVVKDVLPDAVLEVGSLWGEQFRKALGWEWVSLNYGEESIDAVASPERCFVLLPFTQARELLRSPEGDCTLTLLFNMVNTGEVPKATPGDYLTLS